MGRRERAVCVCLAAPPHFHYNISVIKTYALVGESGTGKSFQAKLVAQKYRIDLVIDDGLLIKDNRILAGRSAKQENSFLAAVKTALFDDKAHRDDVARKLVVEKSRKILIIGTSEKMVNKIAVRLQLPPPKKIIRIEDISSQADIEKAIRIRRIEGKHIIPVPGMEVRQNYPNIFYETVNIFKQKKITDTIGGAIPRMHEKSLVKPSYSRRSRIPISDEALGEMVINCVDEYNPNIMIKKTMIKESKEGYHLVITIDVPYGIQLSSNMYAMRQYIIDNIERFTSILIEEVNIIIDKIINNA
jgi:ABC-type oligopeptide transport system ATPase subunit